jgi:hypothetical protein
MISWALVLQRKILRVSVTIRTVFVEVDPELLDSFSDPTTDEAGDNL